MVDSAHIPGIKKAILFSKILLLFWCLSLIGSVAKGKPTKKDTSQHILWKVTSKDGQTGYLVGSVHALKPNIYPLATVYQRAFKNSDQLVFEVNIDSLKAHRFSLMRRFGYLPSGTMLKDTLSGQTYQLLKKQLGSLGLPIARFQRMKPWLVSIVIMDMKLRKAGYREGIDQHFFTRAQKAGKQRIGLESPAFQFRLLDNLSSVLTEKYIKHSLHKADRTVSQINKIVSAWKRGDVTRLDSLVDGAMRRDNPALYKALVLKRNRNWMPKIMRLLNNSKTTMIIVGAGHMVGKNGLVSQLRRQGYQVQQL